MNSLINNAKEFSSTSIQITLKDLGKRFNREWIFRKLNYTTTPGIYAITGANGSGKSTLLQVLWGQMPQTTGSISYTQGGKALSVEDLYKVISIATPYMDLIDELTLEEHLEFHFKLKKSRDNRTIPEIIEAMYLQDAKDKYIANFSSGMRQRLKLGLAFFTYADVIFLDEPGTNLDTKAFEWYLQTLHEIPADCTVFIASNQQAEYPENAQKIDIMLHK